MRLLKTIMMLAIFVGTTAIAGGKDDGETFHVKYEVNFESDDPEAQQSLPFLAGSSMEVMKNGKYSKNIFKTGSVMTMTTVLENTSGKGITITEGMMGNFYTKIDGDEEGEEEDVKVEKTSETKKILGYKCVKYIITNGEDEIIIWAASELKGSFDSKFNVKSDEIEGFPLMMEIEGEQMSITIKATSYAQKVPASEKFSMKPPEGYEEKDLEGMMEEK